MVFKLNFLIFGLIVLFKLSNLFVVTNATPLASTLYPLVEIGDRQYYMGIVNKVNWYKALQFCTLHHFRMISITTKQDNTNIDKLIKDYGHGSTKFWTSGNDLGERKSHVWMGNGQPFSFKNWHTNEPSYDKDEYCIELWKKDNNTGFRWNDTKCSLQMYFICERDIETEIEE